MKRPSFQFYPGDWLNDASLRMVSVGARGLWMDMICLMHQGIPYGHLKVNSKVITTIQLTRMVGGEQKEVEGYLGELQEAGTFSLTEDDCIFSRRMIRDEELRELRAAGGKEGGNPKLIAGYNKPGFVYAMLRSGDGAIKIGISQEPAKRLYKIRAQYPDDDVTVIGKRYVEDMGATEVALHKKFAAKKSGEWFSLDEKELETLLNVHLKVTSTPSSSSSSSSPSSSTEALKTIVSEYPPSFEGAWSIYPKRPGASKKEAFKAWSARIKGGIPEMEIIDGIKRYAEYCTNSDVDPQYIKQPATFFGVGLHFQSDWTYKPRPTNSVQEARLETARQIMGGSYGNNRQAIDITPARPNTGYREVIPEIIDGIWDADVGEMAGLEHP